MGSSWTIFTENDWQGSKWTNWSANAHHFSWFVSNLSAGGGWWWIFHVCLLPFSYPRTVFNEVPVRGITLVKWLASSDSQQTAVVTLMALACAVAVGTTMWVVKRPFYSDTILQTTFAMTVVRLLYVSHRLLHWSITWSKTNCNGRRTPKLMEECISSWMALMEKLRRWDGGGCCSNSAQKQWERLMKKTAKRPRLEIYRV